MGEGASIRNKLSRCQPKKVNIIFSSGARHAVVINKFTRVLSVPNHVNALYALMPIALRWRSVDAPGSTEDWRKSAAVIVLLASSKVVFKLFNFDFPCIISNPLRSKLWYDRAVLRDWHWSKNIVLNIKTIEKTKGTKLNTYCISNYIAKLSRWNSSNHIPTCVILQRHKKYLVAVPQLVQRAIAGVVGLELKIYASLQNFEQSKICLESSQYYISYTPCYMYM